MFRTFAAAAAAFALVVAGCSSGSSSSETTTTAVDTTSSTSVATTTVPATTSTLADDGFPVTINAPNGPVTIEKRPERIVSISPTSTEVLFAIGAGEQVVAVDSLSTYPEGVPTTDLSAFTPNVEAIAGFDPDLVFVSFDPTGDLLPSLDALGIPVIMHSAAFTVADAYGQWEQTGVATGRVAEAAQLVASTSASIESAYAEVPQDAELTYYYELDDTFFSVTSSTFIGDLLSGSNMANIADPADEEGFGYPQLTSEYIVDADPDLIVLADTKCCGQNAETISGRPGWSSLTAVNMGSIVELDDDIASRWGPRIAMLVDDVVVAILNLQLANA